MRYMTTALWTAMILGCAVVSAQDSTCLIRPGQVGPFRVGMKIRQAKRMLAGATFKDGEDAEGLAILIVSRNGAPLLHIYPDQDALENLELIRVLTPDCATADGVHIGLPLAEVEKRYGRLVRIERTEVEKREEAGFEKGPGWMDIDVGSGEAGVYPKGKRCAQSYRPGAKIQGLWVRHAAAKSSRFFENDTMCGTL